MISNPLFHNLGILKVQDLYKFYLLLYMHDVFYERKSIYIKNEILSIQNHHCHRLRNDNLYRLPDVNVIRFKHSFLYQGINMWNNLPNSYKNNSNKNVFRKQLFKFLLSYD